MSNQTIQVRFFASLREQLGHGEVEISIDAVNTVADVWQHASNGMEMPANMLMAVNMEYVEASSPVIAGDEIAFFPPVTGG